MAWATRLANKPIIFDTVYRGSGRRESGKSAVTKGRGHMG